MKISEIIDPIVEVFDQFFLALDEEYITNGMENYKWCAKHDRLWRSVFNEMRYGETDWELDCCEIDAELCWEFIRRDRENN